MCECQCGNFHDCRDPGCTESGPCPECQGELDARVEIIEGETE